MYKKDLLKGLVYMYDKVVFVLFMVSKENFFFLLLNFKVPKFMERD